MGVVSDGTTVIDNGAVNGVLSLQSVQTTGFTAVAGRAYPCNTTSAGFTVTLPATPSAGDQVQLIDYAGTWDTNNLTINPNGEDILGQASNVVASKDREAITLTYIDSTQGWIPSSGYQEGTQGLGIPYSIDFLVIAGGGSGAHSRGGGGGAGGYRTSTQTVNPGTVITVTVGDGGSSVSTDPGDSGSNSSISGSGLTTITSAGGGGGGGPSGTPGGSGGGNSGGRPAGSGNTPVTSPSQGNDGATAAENPPYYGAGGGGGAGAVGTAGGGPGGGPGGAGTASSITGSSITRAGGGGGGATGGPVGAGGAGGGGPAGAGPVPGTPGTVNTGGGGGGGGRTPGVPYDAGSGGKGVVILSLPDANYSGTTTGSPTVATGVSGKTVLTFTGSGSYTA